MMYASLNLLTFVVLHIRVYVSCSVYVDSIKAKFAWFQQRRWFCSFKLHMPSAINIIGLELKLHLMSEGPGDCCTILVCMFIGPRACIWQLDLVRALRITGLLSMNTICMVTQVTVLRG
jgi:hypothetical protein